MASHSPSRRLVLGSAAALPVILGTALPGRAATAVDMEAVLLAAQGDPPRNDTRPTAGARVSVTAVESALAARGLLADRLVDGHFGTSTRTAYRSWQLSLGYADDVATGLPDPASLTRLGTGRFTIVRPVNVGPRVDHRGFPLNTRTRDMLRAAERRLGSPLPLTQGSYSPGEDPTSAGTHDRGGAVDIEARHLEPGERTAAARALREVGFAAWVRSPSQGSWPWHLHAIALSDTDLSSPALRQAGAYLLGRNGLKNDGPDDGPRVPKLTYENYLRGQNR